MAPYLIRNRERGNHSLIGHSINIVGIHNMLMIVKSHLTKCFPTYTSVSFILWLIWTTITVNLEV